MNQGEFNKVVNETVSGIQKLLAVKGGEYAGPEDRLGNFKRGAKLTGITPLQVAFVYASKHYDGIATYIRKSASGEPMELSEPIEGRLDDLINYCILMKAIIGERGAPPEQTRQESTILGAEKLRQRLRDELAGDIYSEAFQKEAAAKAAPWKGLRLRGEEEAARQTAPQEKDKNELNWTEIHQAVLAEAAARKQQAAQEERQAKQESNSNDTGIHNDPPEQTYGADVDTDNDIHSLFDHYEPREPFYRPLPRVPRPPDPYGNLPHPGAGKGGPSTS